jgi:hypothetical protein
MARLLLAAILVLSAACGGARASLPDVSYLTAIEARMLVSAGRALAALDAAESAALRVRRIVSVSPIPERLKATVTPVIHRFEQALESAQQALEKATTPDDVQQALGPVITARTALVNILRLYEELALAREILDTLPRDVQ